MTYYSKKTELMTDPKEKRESKEMTNLERLAFSNAIELLKAAAEAGIKPDEETLSELLRLWKVEKSEDSPEGQGGGIETIQKKVGEKVESVLPMKDLKQKVEAAIQECMGQKVPIGARKQDHIFSAHGIKTSSEEVGAIIMASLEESLKNNDSLETIARKVTLLHSFPPNVGGGQYNSLYGVPKLRKELIQRLLKEIPNCGDDPKKNENFNYISARVASTWSEWMKWDEILIEKNNLKHITDKKELAKAILELVLKNI